MVKYSDKELLDILRDYYKEHNKSPYCTNISQADTIRRRFKDWNNALILAGLDINKKTREQSRDKEMIKKDIKSSFEYIRNDFRKREFKENYLFLTPLIGGAMGAYQGFNFKWDDENHYPNIFKRSLRGLTFGGVCFMTGPVCVPVYASYKFLDYTFDFD